MVESSGADRDRTDNLIHAMDALSQLSYSPNILSFGQPDGRVWPSRGA